MGVPTSQPCRQKSLRSRIKSKPPHDESFKAAAGGIVSLFSRAGDSGRKWRHVDVAAVGRAYRGGRLITHRQLAHFIQMQPTQPAVGVMGFVACVGAEERQDRGHLFKPGDVGQAAVGGQALQGFRGEGKIEVTPDGRKCIEVA